VRGKREKRGVGGGGGERVSYSSGGRVSFCGLQGSVSETRKWVLGRTPRFLRERGRHHRFWGAKKENRSILEGTEVKARGKYDLSVGEKDLRISYKL